MKYWSPYLSLMTKVIVDGCDVPIEFKYGTYTTYDPKIIAQIEKRLGTNIFKSPEMEEESKIEPEKKIEDTKPSNPIRDDHIKTIPTEPIITPKPVGDNKNAKKKKR